MDFHFKFSYGSKSITKLSIRENYDHNNKNKILHRHKLFFYGVATAFLETLLDLLHRIVIKTDFDYISAYLYIKPNKFRNHLLSKCNKVQNIYTTKDS